MKIILFVLLFLGLLTAIAGGIFKIQHWQIARPTLAAGMAMQALAIGLLLWIYIVQPGFSKKRKR